MTLATSKRMFEVFDEIYKEDMIQVDAEAKAQRKRNLKQLNATIGQYQSINQKIDWSVEDPVLYDLAIQRIREIEKKVLLKYKEAQRTESKSRIVNLHNKACVTNAVRY